jgi:hypothetical protein
MSENMSKERAGDASPKAGYDQAPWRVVYDGVSAYGIPVYGVSEYGVAPQVANVFGEANAHLIAAAPELLEACRGLIAANDRCHDDPFNLGNAIAHARAAIAKAEGR